MTLEELNGALETLGATERSGASWRLSVDASPSLRQTITCLADAAGDTLRLVCPLAELADLTEEDKDRLLEASFRSSLSARFGSFEGVVVAAWGGRLSTLDPPELADAVAEVLALALLLRDGDPAPEPPSQR